MNWLKQHPFAVEAFFSSSVVLTFAVPVAQLTDLLPPRLELDTYQDRWGFVAIAMVQTQRLRPKGFPAILGQDFFLIGYRIFVCYRNLAGKRLRGLYILKSETDSWQMTQLGNFLTHYGYTQTDIQHETKAGNTKIRSTQSNFDVQLSRPEGSVALPVQSPFPDWKIARRFAGPLPHTFTALSPDAMLIVRGIRQNWKPQPIRIDNYHFAFLRQWPSENMVLASAFEVRQIPYHWEKGIVEQWP